MAVLDSILQRLGAAGWRIETRSEVQATVAHGKDLNHVLHLILTLVTLGAWVLIWIVLAIFGGLDRRLVTIDEYGNAVYQKL